ncbi:acetyltransferase [[Limnothrix rosea] IAM M-220]|uniref:acetyltransferase n=1 Tax=[Limnothrix rosea] IAM M-220 TaxID=454133 RepID=UPI00095EBCCC|nr:acetyltransferase [[Limnothrix rosea] IAM M-220]OKH18563.1 acetyltransferase [[Limnothrix rosea] IAM M-220]
MFLRYSLNDTLVEVMEPQTLWDPFQTKVLGRSHAGEEMQEPELLPKKDLIFPSGESLPKAWLDPEYNLEK